MGLGPDPDANVEALTALCGGLAGAACAVYNRIADGGLRSAGQWNLPAGLDPVGQPFGGVCDDIIRGGVRAGVVSRGLPDPSCAPAPPGFNTFAGHAVFMGGQAVGCLCAAYQADVEVRPEALALLSIVAAALGAEDQRRSGQEAVREVEARHQLVLEGAAGGIWDWNLAAKRVHLSARWKAMRGYAEDEIGDSEAEWSSRIHPEDVTRVMAAVEDHVSGGNDCFAAEYRVRCKDGSFIWVLGRGKGVRNAAGQVVRMAGSEVDITERKHAEAKLRQLALAVEQSPAAVMITDAEARIIYVNRAFENDSGYTAEEVMGRTPRFLQSGETAAKTYSELWAAISSGREWRGELHNRHKDGHLYWESVSIAPVLDADGRITHYLAVEEDITERKLDDEALQLSESRFRNAFEHSAIGVALVSPDGRWLKANRRVCHILGYTEPELMRLTFQEITHPADLELDLDFVRRMLAGEIESYEMEKRYRHKDGHIVWVLLAVSLVRDAHGAPLHFISQIQDITERKYSEHELRESAAMLARSQELAHVGSWKLDVATGRLDWSDEVYRIVGYDPQEITATVDTLRGSVHPNDLAAVLDAHTGSARDGSDGYEIEHRIIRKATGEVRHVRDQCLHERDADGHIVQSIGIVQDITDRKRIEAYLQTGATLLALLSDRDLALQDVLQSTACVLREQTGLDAVGIRLRQGDDYPYYGSQGFSEEFLRAEGSLLAGLQDGGVCRHPDGTPRLECTCGLVISGQVDRSNPLFTGRGSCFANNAIPLADMPASEDPRFNPRNRCIHEGFASVALVPIRHGEETLGLLHLACRAPGSFPPPVIPLVENLASSLGTALARHQSEEARERSEFRFQTLIENHAAVMLVVDPATGAIIDANPAAVSFYGWSRDQLRRMHIQDINLLDDRSVKEEMEKARAHKKSYFEFRHRLADGSVRDVAVFSSSLTEAGRSVLYSVIHDITESKQAEAERERLQSQVTQAQKMETVGRLAGGVAHDFNNMLGIIIGYGQLALDGLQAGDPLRADIAEIVAAGERSATLTRQLLAFSRKQTLKPEVVDLNALVRNIERMLGRLIGEDIELTMALAAGVGPVLADPGQIEQVVMNLVVNARDAMPDGGRLTVETANGEADQAFADRHVSMQPGPYVKLTVTDTGAGMDAETQQRIFEPFFTTKERGKGTGLGLATVYGIVRQSGGCIDVQSEPGSGTTFSVYLPQTLDAAEPADTRTDSSVRASGGEHILVVEDEAGLRELMGQMLTHMKYRVTLAANGGEALLLVEEKGLFPDLVLTDMVMPSMDGNEVIRRLRRSIPDLKAIIVSGYTDNRIVVGPAMPFLHKPVSMAALGDKVREVLSRDDP
jgi:PAS domain S-box-containing protein